MPETIDVVVNGIPLHLTRPKVTQAMAGVPAEPVRIHAVRVGSTLYPVKQVFECATGIDRLDFTSATARRHLGRLGFTLSRVET
jgi:hypothetical protein